VPNNDKGVPALPIRLRVGEATGEHKGHGVRHIADNVSRSADRAVPKRTTDKAENIAREVVDVLGV
jgi:hypothetical protein